MRVLYVVDTQRDATAFLLYLGLAKEIGVDNVEVYPWTQVYVGEARIGATYAWMNAAVTSLARTSGPRGEPWAAGYDLVTLSSVRPAAIELLNEVIAKNGRWAIKKLAVVDAEDARLRLDAVERFAPDVYCKVSAEDCRPWEDEEQLGGRLVHLPRVVSGIYKASDSVEDVARVISHGRARARQLLAVAGVGEVR